MGKLYRKSYGNIRLSREEKLAVDTIKTGIGLLKKGKSAYSERVRKRRLAKAQLVKRLIQSDLPAEVKQREIAKLSGIASQTKAKAIFFKLKRTPREVRQASEANF